jgi:hypothetical protein
MLRFRGVWCGKGRRGSGEEVEPPCRVLHQGTLVPCSRQRVVQSSPFKGSPLRTGSCGSGRRVGGAAPQGPHGLDGGDEGGVLVGRPEGGVDERDDAVPQGVDADVGHAAEDDEEVDAVEPRVEVGEVAEGEAVRDDLHQRLENEEGGEGEVDLGERDDDGVALVVSDLQWVVQGEHNDVGEDAGQTQGLPSAIFLQGDAKPSEAPLISAYQEGPLLDFFGIRPGSPWYAVRSITVCGFPGQRLCPKRTF